MDTTKMMKITNDMKNVVGMDCFMKMSVDVNGNFNKHLFLSIYNIHL